MMTILSIKAKPANNDNPIITLTPSISINDGSGFITSHDLGLVYIVCIWLYPALFVLQQMV